MKEMELRKYALCSICKKTIGSSGLPLFYRVTVERFGVDLGAVHRQTGLSMLIGNARIAHIMGTDAEMARPMAEPVVLCVCEPCSVEMHMIAQLVDYEGVKV